METKKLISMTADLAEATVILAKVAKELAIDSRSLNALGTTEHGISCPPEIDEADKTLTEDICLVKNIDLLSPVDVREKESIDDIILAEAITIEEARPWFLATFGTLGMEILKEGFIPDDYIIRKYTEAFLKYKKGKVK